MHSVSGELSTFRAARRFLASEGEKMGGGGVYVLCCVLAELIEFSIQRPWSNLLTSGLGCGSMTAMFIAALEDDLEELFRHTFADGCLRTEPLGTSYVSDISGPVVFRTFLLTKRNWSGCQFQLSAVGTEDSP